MSPSRDIWLVIFACQSEQVLKPLVSYPKLHPIQVLHHSSVIASILELQGWDAYHSNVLLSCWEIQTIAMSPHLSSPWIKTSCHRIYGLFIGFCKDSLWQIRPSPRWCCGWMIIKLFSMPQEATHQNEYDKKRRKGKHHNPNNHKPSLQCFRIGNKVPSSMRITRNHVNDFLLIISRFSIWLGTSP